MRFSVLLTFFLLALVLAVSFAEPQAQASVQAPQPDPALKKHVNELNAKIQSLADDLKTLRTSLDAIRRENESIKKSVHVATERAGSASNDDAIKSLRAQIDDLRVSIRESTLLHQASTAFNKSKVVAERLLNQYVVPHTKTALQVSGKYLSSVTSQGVVVLGATQSLLSKQYHFARSILEPQLKASRQFIEDKVRSTDAVPVQYRKFAPVVATVVISAALFFASLFVFSVVYGIISLVLRTLCCCCRSAPSKKKHAAPVQATSSLQLKGKNRA